MRKEFERAGCIGRFKPLHLGSQGMLEALCEKSEHLTIGIGSSNKYNMRNPFTPEETKGMVDAALANKFSNYSVIFVPDYGNGKLWREHVVSEYRDVNVFVSGNKYVQALLKDDFRIISSYDVVSPEKSVELNASYVRFHLATGGKLDGMVSHAVAKYLRENDLVSRFLLEFGHETISEYVGKKMEDKLTLIDEEKHTYEK